MYNPYYAEHMLVLDGKKTPVKMTLGALAALEHATSSQSLAALIEKFANNEQSATDLIHVLNAGLYGAGQTPNIENQIVEGGASAASRTAMELLQSAFPNGLGAQCPS